MATRDRWLPYLNAGAKPTAHDESQSPDDHGSHDHGDHGHDHGHGEEELNSVRLSEQARANLGLKVGTIELANYTRTLVIPGAVVEQPGHSERRITTALPGVVSKVYAYPGQAIRPGDPLLDIQPTGDLLSTAQAELLKTLQDIELVEVELKRLSPLVENGSIPARTRIEKDYERRRLESQKEVQIQELLVRGLTADQINELVAHKTLLREFTIYVPGDAPRPPAEQDRHEHPSVVPTSLLTMEKPVEKGASEVVYTIERMDIFPGKLVEPGDELCDLALHTELYLEGHAFERDSRIIAQAVQEQRPITAIFEGEADQPETREGLVIRYVENSLNATSRTLRFFVPLRNEIVRDSKADNGLVYRSWRFKPGQKVRLLLPVQQLKEQLVLPAEAVVSEGPDSFLFRANGELLERVPVVVEQRDPRQVVLRNDGSVFPGDEVAMNQAYQINLALKKQQGSGVDPHAGHNH